MKTCKSCGGELPQKRADFGYNECVKCSTTETYGFVNIINHKTGNTIQPMPKEQAAAINKIGDRKRFGTVLRGGSKSTTYKPKKIVNGGCSTTYIGSKESFDKVGQEALITLDYDGLEAAISFVERQVKDYIISGNQAFQIRQILHNFSTQKQLC